MNSEALLSSKSSEYSTPQELFNALNFIFRFDLDPASTHENAKCEKHFTKEEDGLKQSWEGHTVFCNPPYGREIGKWVKKAYEESRKPGTTVVMLLPARTDTEWFHNYCLKGSIRFMKGRLRFGGSGDRAPFPNMIVTFEGGRNYAEGKLV